MEKVLRGINDIEKYLDDISCFSETWEAHLHLLDKILHRLEANGNTVNPSKCEWAVKETNWLGHWLKPVGIKPRRKKIKVILRMQPPKDVRQV
jgi:Reverse transcriptase (RNA-dependent DNA polymerase)